MKIAFLGLKGAFDYYQIGGVESFVRRISSQLIDRGIEADYLLYGAEEERSSSPYQGLRLKYFMTFEEVLGAITEDYEHVLTIYLLPKHRMKYASFRKISGGRTRFHFIYFGWPDSLIKRKLYFAEAKFFPYNGKLFCISKRQHDYVRKGARNSVFILPPVPTAYFLEPEEKTHSDRIRVTFLGRIDPGKGIDDVIELFFSLQDRDRYEFNIHGIHIPEDQESLELHEWLKRQKEIRYHEVDRQNYAPWIDDHVREVLKNTDIFIQPYMRLSSTIDTPLLLLEAMASLCAVITKPFGNIAEIYGPSKFILSDGAFSADVKRLLGSITRTDIYNERQRIHEQNQELNCREDEIAKQFLASLSE